MASYSAIAVLRAFATSESSSFYRRYNICQDKSAYSGLTHIYIVARVYYIHIRGASAVEQRVKDVASLSSSGIALCDYDLRLLAEIWIIERVSDRLSEKRIMKYRPEYL